MTSGERPRAYLDANVFIEALEGIEEISAPIREFFTRLKVAQSGAFTSELTLAEVLAPRSGVSLNPPLKRRYLDLMVWSRLFELRPVSRHILYETVRLRGVAKLKLPDAIHLATAIDNGCMYFLSRDADFKRMPRGMRRIEPSAAGLASVIEALQ